MSDEQINEAETAGSNAPMGVGGHLRAAREEKGLTLEQVAAETRISRRHLEHIEDGEFDKLAGRTYAVGFARTYAKVVGLDQEDVADMVRAEMQLERPREYVPPADNFEPGDPNRAPGGGLVWFSLIAVVLLLAGIFFASRVLFAPAADLPALTEEEEAAETVAAGEGAQSDAASDVDPSGQVVFTAEGEVWVRFYDAQNRVLSERTMAEGDSYTIPADANGPRIITGRPDLLAITIGGQSVPKLSTEIVTLDGAEVSATALLARDAPSASTPSTTN